MEDIIARKLFREQIRKELLDELMKYKVGLIHEGQMVARKSSDTWDGHIFVIPNPQYNELFDKSPS